MLTQSPTDTELTAAWRKLAEKALGGAAVETISGRTADGIPIEPFYPAARHDRPIATRPPGTPWAIVQRADDPDTQRAKEQAARDIDGGAGIIALAFEGAASAGGFGLGVDQGETAALVRCITEKGAGIRIEPHPRGRRTAAWVADAIASPSEISVSFGLDPIGNFARWGVLSAPWPEVATRFVDTVTGLKEGGFSGPFAEADGRPYHEAGATDAQELAAALATAVAYIRALDAAGIGLADTFAAVGLSLSVDCDQFAGIAKLRAARLLWARLQEACAVPATPVRIHADTSRRMMIAADQHTNLLRTTIAAFAAGVGGADTLCVLPYSAARGLPHLDARRYAANIQHLLIEEAHVAVTADPAAGSGAVATLTDALAKRAWAQFQEIEREGGIVASLSAGKLQKRIEDAAETRRGGIEGGAVTLVGLNKYRNDTSGAVSVLDAKPCPAPTFRDVALTCPPLNPVITPSDDVGRVEVRT